MNTLKEILIVPTFSCDGSCFMCGNYKRKIHIEVDFNRLCTFLNSIKGKAGVQTVQFTGGNVNLYSKYRELCVFCGNTFVNAILILTTNMRNPGNDIKNISYLKSNLDNRLYLSLPLEGKPHTHNFVRGSAESFNNLLYIINNCKEIILGSSFTITKKNYQDLLWVHSFSLDNGLDFWANPMNSGYFYNTNYVSPIMGKPILSVAKSLNTIVERELSLGLLENGSTKYKYFLRLIDYYAGRLSLSTSYCDAGKTQIVISENGEIYPCIFKHNSIGNIQNGITSSPIHSNCFCLTACHSGEQY